MTDQSQIIDLLTDVNRQLGVLCAKFEGLDRKSEHREERIGKLERSIIIAKTAIVVILFFVSPAAIRAWGVLPWR